MKDKAALIGLGTMGLPMAQCLVRAEADILGWDVSDSARDRFEQSVASLAELANSRDIFITMLPQGEHVSQVYAELIEARVRPGALFIDCSTIDVVTTRRLAKVLVDKGHGFVDAPVSGGAEAAASGQLSFMLGGSDKDIQRAAPWFDIMGKQQTCFGKAGAGQSAKACHNMICGITALGVCEAFALADALGLDQQKFFSLCQGAAAQSWILENRCPVPGPAPDAPASHNYAPGFAARLMAKDLGLAQQAAEASQQKTEFGAAAAKRFREFVETNDGDLDFSAIYRSIRQ